MTPLWIPFIVAVGQVAPQQTASEPIVVRYATSTVGRQVTVILDGKEQKPMFAGKLGFQDSALRWTSLCADVRSPINIGQMFAVESKSSLASGGNVTKAGNIVARHFSAAKSADECAGLQVAVWEAMEDGNLEPDFAAGKFGVKTTPSVLKLAGKYYDAIDQPGNAEYLAQIGQPGFGNRGGGRGPGGQGPGGSGPGGGNGQNQFRGFN